MEPGPLSSFERHRRLRMAELERSVMTAATLGLRLSSPTVSFSGAGTRARDFGLVSSWNEPLTARGKRDREDTVANVKSPNISSPLSGRQLETIVSMLRTPELRGLIEEHGVMGGDCGWAPRLALPDIAKDAPISPRICAPSSRSLLHPTRDEAEADDEPKQPKMRRKESLMCIDALVHLPSCA